MRLFITGTDTEVGKTYISCSLLDYFKQQGRSTIGIKPIASGAEITQEGLRNEDALALQKHASIHLPYAHVNPITFLPPIAPHIAATLANFDLSVNNVIHHCQAALNTPADIHLIEGAGGWLVPLHHHQNMADLALALEAEVILVVGMRLGCINHALLSKEAIQNKGCKFKGWIANCLTPKMPYLAENLQTLEARMEVPLLSTVAYQGKVYL